jgi:hypothetical protein
MPTFVDDFNRADGALAAPWMLHNGDGPDMPSVISNQAGFGPGDLGGAYYSGLYMTGPQQSVQVTVSVLPTTYVGVTLCHQDANNAYYGYWSAGSGGVFEIYAYVGGSFGAPKASAAGTMANGDTLGLDHSGTTLTLYKNGSSVLTWTDPLATFGAGFPGFGIEDATGRVDNFTANYGGVAAPPLTTSRRR